MLRSSVIKNKKNHLFISSQRLHVVEANKRYGRKRSVSIIFWKYHYLCYNSEQNIC